MLPLLIFAISHAAPMRVFIDPGHGGKDLGAVHGGVSEAEVVLAVGLKLKKILDSDSQFEAQMSRTTDVLIPLPERNAAGDAWKADVMLSLHANASEHQSARGVEFYFQNHLKPDEESFYFANLENQMSAKSKEDSLTKSTDVLSILEDLKKTHRIWQSSALAKSLLKGWAIERKTRSQPIRQAPFQVVSAGNFASVLIEMGFLSNPREAQSMRAEAVQNEIARKIHAGLVHFKSEVLDKTKSPRVP